MLSEIQRRGLAQKLEELLLEGGGYVGIMLGLW